jgi:hypothetical protein
MEERSETLTFHNKRGTSVTDFTRRNTEKINSFGARQMTLKTG